MLDGLIEGKCRTHLNFLVSCHRKTMFIEFVDIYAMVKMLLLCSLFDELFPEIGVEHVA